MEGLVCKISIKKIKKLQQYCDKYCELIKNIDYVTYNYLVTLGLMFARPALYH